MQGDKINIVKMTSLLVVFFSFLMLASTVSAGWLDGLDGLMDGIHNLQDQQEQMMQNMADYYATYTGEEYRISCPTNYQITGCTPLTADNCYLSEKEGMFQYGAFVLADNVRDLLFPIKSIESLNAVTVSEKHYYSVKCGKIGGCRYDTDFQLTCPAGYKLAGTRLDMHESHHFHAAQESQGYNWVHWSFRSEGISYLNTMRVSATGYATCEPVTPIPEPVYACPPSPLYKASQVCASNEVQTKPLSDLFYNVYINNILGAHGHMESGLGEVNVKKYIFPPIATINIDQESLEPEGFVYDNPNVHIHIYCNEMNPDHQLAYCRLKLNGVNGTTILEAQGGNVMSADMDYTFNAGEKYLLTLETGGDQGTSTVLYKTIRFVEPAPEPEPEPEPQPQPTPAPPSSGGGGTTVSGGGGGSSSIPPAYKTKATKSIASAEELQAEVEEALAALEGTGVKVPKAEALYEEGKAKLEEARDYFDERKYTMADKLSLEAIGLFEQALALIPIVEVVEFSSDYQEAGISLSQEGIDNLDTARFDSLAEGFKGDVSFKRTLKIINMTDRETGETTVYSRLEITFKNNSGEIKNLAIVDALPSKVSAFFSEENAQPEAVPEKLESINTSLSYTLKGNKVEYFLPILSQDEEVKSTYYFSAGLTEEAFNSLPDPEFFIRLPTQEKCQVMDCDDSDPSTLDSCANGICRHEKADTGLAGLIGLVGNNLLAVIIGLIVVVGVGGYLFLKKGKGNADAYEVAEEEAADEFGEYSVPDEGQETGEWSSETEDESLTDKTFPEEAFEDSSELAGIKKEVESESKPAKKKKNAKPKKKAKKKK